MKRIIRLLFHDTKIRDLERLQIQIQIQIQDSLFDLNLNIESSY